MEYINREEVERVLLMRGISHYATIESAMFKGNEFNRTRAQTQLAEVCTIAEVLGITDNGWNFHRRCQSNYELAKDEDEQ
jgi:hypothetical protein